MTAVAAGTALASLVAGLPPATAGGGGAAPPKGPRVADARCVKLCAGTRKATAGSKVELTGRHLADTGEVRFDAAGDSQLPVAPTKVRERAVKVKVPAGAVSGAPKVVDSLGRASSAPKELRIVSPDEIPEPGSFVLESARATPGSVCRTLPITGLL